MNVLSPAPWEWLQTPLLSMGLEEGGQNSIHYSWGWRLTLGLFKQSIMTTSITRRRRRGGAGGESAISWELSPRPDSHASPLGIFLECIFASALNLSQSKAVFRWELIRTGCLLCARDFSKHFKCICSLSPHHSTTSKILLLSPLCRWRNWGPCPRACN